MANINYDIRHGFFDLLLASGNTAFRAAIAKTVGGTTYHKLYYVQAPQAFPDGTTLVTPPYVVFNILPIEPDRDSATKFYSCWVQLLVSSLSATECEDIAGYITAILEDSESRLTIGAYTVREIRRQAQINLGVVETVNNIAVQYSLIFEG